METIVQERPLSPVEQIRLGELEGIIRDNFLAYVAVGSALLEIRENRLYRNDEGRTWEGYCRELWDMSHQRADQLIAAKVVAENLTTIVVKDDGSPDWELLPSNEAQARELARLAPEEQRQVWQQLIEAKQSIEHTTPAKITAKAVKSAVAGLKGEKLSSAIKKATDDVKDKGGVEKKRQSEAFEQAWEALMDQIEEERRFGWKHTPRKEVCKVLLSLAAAVGECGEPTRVDTRIVMQAQNAEKLIETGWNILRIGVDKTRIEQMEAGGTWLVRAEYADAEQCEAAFHDLLLEQGNLRA